MNLDDRLRAASKALKESSVAQIDAASRLPEILRRTGQPLDRPEDHERIPQPAPQRECSR
jgi:hypothetical protein